MQTRTSRATHTRTATEIENVLWMRVSVCRYRKRGYYIFFMNWQTSKNKKRAKKSKQHEKSSHLIEQQQKQQRRWRQKACSYRVLIGMGHHHHHSRCACSLTERTLAYFFHSFVFICTSFFTEILFHCMAWSTVIDEQTNKVDGLYLTHVSLVR